MSSSDIDSEDDFSVKSEATSEPGVEVEGIGDDIKDVKQEFREIPELDEVSLEEGLTRALARTQVSPSAVREFRREKNVYQNLRRNNIFAAQNRQGAARARLEAINESFQVQEPEESRRFDSLTTEARLWLLLHELGHRELCQFEAATSFHPEGRDVQEEGEVEALMKRVQEEAIGVITAQEDRGGERGGTRGPGNAQYLREMCAAKAPFVMNNFYDHMGGINMRGRAQATGGFTTEELRQNNVLQMVYEQDGSSYTIDPEAFPQAAQTLFSTLRRTT